MNHSYKFHRLRSISLALFALTIVASALVFMPGLVKAEPVNLQGPENIQGPDLIVFPEPPNVQGSIDAVLACRNGSIFEFHAIDTQASLDGEPLDWDISFANENGLLIAEYPLWLAKSKTPFVHGELTYPYSSRQMLLWRERVPVGPLVMCISGPGTGFCETTIEIENCYIAPSLVTDISQIGLRSTEPIVSDSLVFETRAYDPRIGTRNGDGIESIRMSVIDQATGADIFWGEPISSTEVVTDTTFCLFTEDCSPYVFADHDYAWPNGEPIEDGAYLLRALVRTPKDERMVVQREIEIVGSSPAPEVWVNPVDDAEFVNVPAGEFIMGSDEDYADEAPLHRVELDDYWIMSTEVTNAQYLACIEDGGCTEPANDRWNSSDYVDHPVTNVDWDQAAEYAAWAGGRLPTEAEWEKAARGPDGQIYPWGDDIDELPANVDFPTGDTMPVGSYPDGASPYGVLDMAGNVEEWVADWYGKEYYADSPAVNPEGAEESTPPLKVLRGGSFQQGRYDVRGSVRGRANPETKYSNVGFRIVITEIE